MVGFEPTIFDQMTDDPEILGTSPRMTLSL
jgi:hypothetical protein